MFFIMLRKFPLSLLFWVYIMNECWILSNAFPASIYMTMWFFFFSLLIHWLTFIDIFNIKPALHYWKKSHLAMICNSFNILLNFTCQYFIKDFCIYIHKGYWSVVFFFVLSLSNFPIKVILVLWNVLRNVPSSSFFYLSRLPSSCTFG